MEIGSISHKVLELKGHDKIKDQDTNYKKLREIYYNGYDEIDEKSDNHILGVNDLQKKYFEEFFSTDNKSGMNYEEKSKLFLNEVLPNRMEDSIWCPLSVEQRFESVYDDRVVIHGFIDRVDVKDGEYRTIDYKTSKKIYDASKVSTSLQFGIYALAILTMFDKLPVENIYRFILDNATDI